MKRIIIEIEAEKDTFGAVVTSTGTDNPDPVAERGEQCFTRILIDNLQDSIRVTKDVAKTKPDLFFWLAGEDLSP